MANNTFQNKANVTKMLEKTIMQVLKKNSLLQGNKTFGSVEDIISETEVLVFLESAQSMEKVMCSPDLGLDVGDRVIVEYINNNPRDKYIMGLLGRGSGTPPIAYESLPTEPVEIIRDNSGRAHRFIYAYDNPIKRWEQELVRDGITGKVNHVVNTYQDGFQIIRTFIRDEQDRLWKYE